MATFRSIAIATAFAGMISLYSGSPAFAQPASSNSASEKSAVAKLHVGDLVRLRSGGPLMTITKIEVDQIHAAWTDVLGEIRAQSFPVAVLQGPIYTPEDKGWVADFGVPFGG
jgi:uncharacterized protein YodC (DUF2158 family)